MRAMQRLLLSIAFSIGVVGAVEAADLTQYDFVTPPAPVAADNGWHGSLYAYGWLTSLDGKSGIDGFPPIDIDISFEEFLENLEWFLAGFGELRRGRFGIVADIFSADISDGINVIEKDVLEVRMGGEMAIATLMGEYRIWEQEKSSLDLMAGARLWYFKDQVDVVIGDRSRIGFMGDSYTWVDPMVGAKMHWQGDSPLYFKGWAMIGGFGVSSKIDWDVFGGIGYEFRKNMSVLAGYRAIGVDYQGDSLLFDVLQHGPMIGTLLEF